MRQHTYQMQLHIPIRVEFEGMMLLETSKDFNVESLKRPIVTPRGAKNDVGKSPSGTRQASWEPWWAVHHATGVVSAQRGRAEGNKMRMILYSGVHNLQPGLLGVKPEDPTLK